MFCCYTMTIESFLLRLLLSLSLSLSFSISCVIYLKVYERPRTVQHSEHYHCLQLRTDPFLPLDLPESCQILGHRNVSFKNNFFFTKSLFYNTNIRKNIYIIGYCSWKTCAKIWKRKDLMNELLVHVFVGWWFVVHSHEDHAIHIL